MLAAEGQTADSSNDATNSLYIRIVGASCRNMSRVDYGTAFAVISSCVRCRVARSDAGLQRFCMHITLACRFFIFHVSNIPATSGPFKVMAPAAQNGHEQNGSAHENGDGGLLGVLDRRTRLVLMGAAGRVRCTAGQDEQAHEQLQR